MQLKNIFIIIIIVVFNFVLNAEILDLNFFTEPHFGNINKTDFIKNNTVNDSIKQINIFGGKILKNVSRDSIIIAFLDSVNCDYTSPTDYMFSALDYKINFEILASNIVCDSIPIITEAIIETDSIKIGIFSLYTPDFVVKKSINPNAELSMKVFDIAKELTETLADKTDFVIMMSSLSKYIDNEITKDLPIDAVVSFDYQKKRNEVLDNKRTNYFGILSHKGIFGKLRFEYENGELTSKWIEKRIK